MKDTIPKRPSFVTTFLHVVIVHTRLVQCWSDTKASLIDKTKSGNVRAKSENAELMLKKELVSPQKPSFCSSRPSNSEALCLFPGIENSSPKSCISLSKISFMKLYIHLNRRECVLLAWSIRDDGREEEMVQKENNILIDETRTDLRQGFHRIHSSSSFLPRLSFYLQASMLAVLRRQDYFKCLKRKPLLSPNLWS